MFGFSGNILEVVIKAFPPALEVAIVLSLTAITPIPCSNIHIILPPHSNNLVILP